MRGVEVCTKVTPEVFYFIAIEKVAPFCVAVYQITDDWLLIGQKDIHEALYRIDRVIQTGKPEGYTPEIMALSPPEWMNSPSKKKVTPLNYHEIPLF